MCDNSTDSVDQGLIFTTKYQEPVGLRSNFKMAATYGELCEGYLDTWF